VDDKTIVVSTSKFAHYHRQQPQPLEAIQSNEDEGEEQHDEMAGATEKFARINLHAIPTSTPIIEEDDSGRTWFADQLTQPVILANALESEDNGNDHDEAAASATPFFSSFDNEDSQRSTPPPVDAVEEVRTEVSAMATPLEHEDETDIQPPQHLLIPNLDEVEEADEGSFFAAPSLEESTDSANSADAQSEQPPIPAWLAALHTAPQFLVPEDNEEVVTESQLESELASTPTPTTEENNTDSKTIVVSSPKRTRSKRRAEALKKTKNTQGNGQTPASHPTNPVPSPVLTRKNQPTVTNNTRGTLQSVGELSTQDNDSASSQAQDENGTGNGKPVYEEP
jgi:hypothetical protein